MGVSDLAGGNSTAGTGVETIGEDGEEPQPTQSVIRSVRTAIAPMDDHRSEGLFNRTVWNIAFSSRACYRMGHVSAICIIHRIYVILLNIFVFGWILHQSIVCRGIWMVWQSSCMTKFVHDN